MNEIFGLAGRGGAGQAPLQGQPLDMLSMREILLWRGVHDFFNMLNFHYENGEVKLYSLGKPSGLVLNMCHLIFPLSWIRLCSKRIL
jgi:hypothetical protein